jgi:hypothetical protein
MERINATFLMDKKEIWDSYIPFINAVYDSEWAKLVIHTVPVQPFNMDDGLDILKSEIETFNPRLKLMRNPIWLSKEENRAQKRHSSILIHLEDEEMARKALNARVFIAGVSCRVQKFIPRHTQCEKCQKYGHTRPYCQGEIQCSICAQDHETIEHKCNICEVSGQECPHIIATCANCRGNHKANDKKCEEWVKVRPRFVRPTNRLNPSLNASPQPARMDSAW